MLATISSIFYVLHDNFYYSFDISVDAVSPAYDSSDNFGNTTSILFSQYNIHQMLQKVAIPITDVVGIHDLVSRCFGRQRLSQ